MTPHNSHLHRSGTSAAAAEPSRTSELCDVPPLAAAPPFASAWPKAGASLCALLPPLWPPWFPGSAAVHPLLAPATRSSSRVDPCHMSRTSPDQPRQLLVL